MIHVSSVVKLKTFLKMRHIFSLGGELVMLIQQVIEIIHIGHMVLGVVIAHDLLGDHWLQCAHLVRQRCDFEFAKCSHIFNFIIKFDRSPPSPTLSLQI